MGPTLKTQAVQQELEDATDSLHQNVDNYHSTRVSSQKGEDLIYKSAEA